MRFREPAALAWQSPVEVVCPRCGSRATVRENDVGYRLTCTRCPLAVDGGSERHVLVDGRLVVLQWKHGAWHDPAVDRYVSVFRAREGEEPVFGLPLWLRTECCGGHLLWANNEEHLGYIESYVGATLRESVGLSTVLPTWMKLAKNREDILRSLHRLRTTLAPG